MDKVSMPAPRRKLRFGFAVVAVALLGMTAATAAAAAEFPTQPVKLLVPWTAGGSTDVVMRSLAEATGKHLGQPVIIENKPGAGGTLAAVALATTATKPDGYTLAQMPISVFRQPFMQKTSYDPLNDFTYIIHLTGYTFGVVVRADAPWQTWNEFVDHAKKNPGKVSYGTPGAGTSLHITMEQLAEKLGVDWLHVPYKGSAETVSALLGNHVTAVADSSGWAPQVEAGQLRLLVTWGAERTKRFPNVPTLQELGYGIVSNSPFGVAGPKGMDPKTVKILHDAFKKGMEEPAFLATLDRFDMQPFYMGSEDYARFVKETVPQEGAMLKKLGFKPD